MIIKKRKRKGKSNNKQSKKSNDKTTISLNSLPITDRVLDNGNEKDVSPAISYREESKRILRLVVYIKNLINQTRKENKNAEITIVKILFVNHLENIVRESVAWNLQDGTIRIFIGVIFEIVF